VTGTRKSVSATKDSTKPLVFSFETPKWTELTSGTFVNWFVSSDHEDLFCTTGGDDAKCAGLRKSRG
jgi:hypothetical protein